jgi:hypothetical protein
MMHVKNWSYILPVLCVLLLACTRSYTDEQIEQIFEPVTSKYGIRIVYKIDETFTPQYQGGGGAHAVYKKLKPIDRRILARYPQLLEQALSKYPIHVVKEYLNAVYFAGIMKSDNINYAGTYDPFRRIIYLIDDGNRSTKEWLGTFHHEFSSLFLTRHGMLLNPWLEHHPEGFQYRSEIYDNYKDIYADTSTCHETAADYENGFMNTYSHTTFDNDFNEYAAMIFTHPEKFKQIMDKHPRVRGKFLVFLDFYEMIDPIFTEEYLLGTKPEDQAPRPPREKPWVRMIR